MKAERDDLILAFYPNARGFAYVIFEGPRSPVDWGIADVPRRKGRVDTYVRRLSTLIDRYRPEVLVLREARGIGLTPDMQASYQAARALGRSRGLRTCAQSRSKIRQAFAHLKLPTRYAIAEGIVRDIPMFTPLMPPPRKIWNGEDRRMGLFDAASLALSYMKLQRPALK